MLKKIMAVMLAICLCVACLPAGASAAQFIGSQAELETFLSNWGYSLFYDSQRVTEAIFLDGKLNILESFLTSSMQYKCDMPSYPGEKSERRFQETDPLGRWPAQPAWYYVKVNADRQRWILENIFNVSSSDYDEMDKAIVNGSNPNIYKLNGYYYYPHGAMGGPSYECKIMESEYIGNKCHVICSLSIPGLTKYLYTIVELKTIGQDTFWTLYYSQEIENGQNPIASGGFVDVLTGSYYAEPVKWAVEHGITSGTSKVTFSPNASCTRGQIVTFLWNAAGKPEPKSAANPFVDIKSNDYFYKPVLWAVENKITSGTDSTHFTPGKPCTRAEAMTFMWRAEGSPSGAASSSFTDVAADSYYAKAVNWAVEEKITSGTSAATFSPNQTCTRGQIVTFLYRNK